MWKRYCVDYETENEWVWNINIKWEKSYVFVSFMFVEKFQHQISCVVVKLCFILSICVLKWLLR
jgi:hypothetical protein